MHLAKMGFERIAGSELLLTDATSERRPDHVLDRLEPGPARPRPHAPLHLQQTHGHLPRDTGSDTTRGCLNVSCGVKGTVNVLCDTFFLKIPAGLLYCNMSLQHNVTICKSKF